MGFSFFRLPLCFGLGLVDEDGDGGWDLSGINAPTYKLCVVTL